MCAFPLPNTMTLSLHPHLHRSSYAEADGTVNVGSTGLSSVAIAEYVGADGLEEMHCFINLGWFDSGSWAWGHFIAEWGTKGIFQVSVVSCRVVSCRVVSPRRLYHTQVTEGHLGERSDAPSLSHAGMGGVGHDVKLC